MAVLSFLALAAAFAVVFGGIMWVGKRARRRGIGGEVMGPFEELWHPAAREYRFMIRVQEVRRVPLPATGDKLRRRRKPSRPA